ncbi:hypothetical protein WR25_13047 isoform A [Diploscapter pachys]|nr:hypothetical protein WR25_13047 isoform A [Diploscapter pachys]
MTHRLPMVECCGCTEKNGDKCPDNGCHKKCRGNYCVVDFEGVEQGCGLGYPRLQNFLRMNNYLHFQGQPICARYEATPSTVMNGCTCTKPSGQCNELNQTRAYQVKHVIERRSDDQNYCYSLMHRSNKPFGQEVFRKSTTCEGQYCFISLTTSEIVLESANFKHNYEDHEEFIGINRPRYEILAGCLKVDDDRKVNVGCTTEYTANGTEPLSKHCICDTHLCNFHHLVAGTEDTRPRATKQQVQAAERQQNVVGRNPIKIKSSPSQISIASTSIALVFVIQLLNYRL